MPVFLVATGTIYVKQTGQSCKGTAYYKLDDIKNQGFTVAYGFF